MARAPLNPAGNGHNGHGPGGRFAPGNKLGRGNPLNRKAQQLRSAYLRAVSTNDMKEIVTAIVGAAKKGDVQAAKEVCDRIMGKPTQQDLLERIEQLESLAAEIRSSNGRAPTN